MIERALRWIAIGVATLAFVDPAVTLAGRAPVRVALLVPRSAHRDAMRQAAAVRESLRRDLGAEFDWIDGLDRTAAATVVVGDRYPDEPIAETAKVSTVTVPPASRSGVRIRSITAPSVIPPATAVRLVVDVHGSQVSGVTSALSVRAGGAEVGRAEHRWAGNDESWSASLDVVPVGESPHTFEVQVGEARQTVIVDAAPRLRVLVYEARPSWASAFVRRALEADPRFAVTGVASAAPAAVITSGASDSAAPASPKFALARANDGMFDAVLVGGLDRLAADDVSGLERFANLRGGAILLLPDAQIPRPVAALLPGVALRETLLERGTGVGTGLGTGLKPVPRPVPTPVPLLASELLEATKLPAESEVIAQSSASRLPVVWATPFGDGIVAVSGAADAWRFRGGPDASFDRFWRSVVSGLALAARVPIAVTVSPDRAALGDRVRVTARVRALERNQLGDRLAVSAAAGGQVVRLWPDAARGVFAGSFVLDSADRTIVTASLAGTDVSGKARVTIDDARELPALPLAMLAQSHGGIDVTPNELRRLAAHLRSTIAASSVSAVRHPMRSVWWFAPFAACLSTEWWLRRRRGAR